MIEIFGNIWNIDCDVRCITTNGCLSTSGHAIIGKGIALSAKLKYPGIEIELGLLIKRFGNNVFELSNRLASFPTKNNWRDKSDLDLIQKSCHQIVDIANKKKYSKIVIPRPGCSNGQLEWSLVKEAIKDILDNRFFIITNEKTGI